jgi:hypothetical protein
MGDSYMEHYDEINAELRQLSAIAAEEANRGPDRLYIGSGEDFDIEITHGSPNRLLVAEVFA